jgi:alkanesulfonate monooxygenase SsuD/methylene tetrahydromethanopterin reductase-like flavin-dependent oxidoreductase (luciferase family)
MNGINLKLSILDQSPMADGDTQADALHHTIELAHRAEEWGYRRFWVAEHHNSERYVGSSPEVLMASDHLIVDS